jgi:hypothetical protein
MQQEECFFMAGGKREDPNYLQVGGYVPRELGLRFKANCTLRQMSQSEALEEAIQLWLAAKQADGMATITTSQIGGVDS